MGRIFTLCFVLISTIVMAQSHTVTGVLRDRAGEKLASAHIFVYPDSVTTLSNEGGRFSLTLTRGAKSIVVSHVAYEPFTFEFKLRRDTTITLTLSERISSLKEVVVTGDRNVQEEVFNANRTSTHVLTKEIITALPVLGGEADVIKTLQLLPGTVRGIEGSSDLFVRGGAADQNLVLLDDVPIYNTSHLFGFLSVFNPDILEKVEAINGGFPAEYGGRLSSILNVQTSSEIPDRTHISADIGVIATRIHLDQPIVKNKASVWLAGRRTYIDQVVRVLNEELPYYFYDLNGKLILQPTKRDNISFSTYFGDDILDIFRDRNNDGQGFLTKYESGNNSQSLRWQRTMRNRWHGSLSLIRSKYKYSVLNAFEENELLARSDIEDYGARLMFRKDSIYRNVSFKSGVDWTRHQLNPNVINSTGTIAELLESSASTGHVANEFAAYTQFDWSPADRWQVGAGIRGSMAVVDSKMYAYPEPRFSVRYSLRENQALKFSYARMVQYLHRISYSAVSSPTDIWYPVTGRIRPQTSHQVALGWQQSLLDGLAFLSIEGYYKQMSQLIGYEEGTNLFLNNDFEPQLIQGKGKAYGVEVLLRKDLGRFTGWISYTLSWSLRQFDEINQGNWFPSRYDRRHNGAIVMQYRFAERWAASIVWEFISGARFTPIIGQYGIFAPTLTGVDLIPVYSGINQVSLADAHRLDAGIKFKSKSGKRFQWQVFAGVYNAYNRANPVGITIEQDEVTGELHYEQPGLFGLIPFVSYGFSF
jgi:hypothetical protein